MIKRFISGLVATVIVVGLGAHPVGAVSGERRIVYMNGLDGHAISINADGTDRRDYGPGHMPKLSPDGTKIAFTRDGADYTRRDLYVANVDGSNVQKVSERVHTLGSPAYFFTWSPDSTKLAFTTEYGATSSMGGEFKQIAVMRADGSNKVQLTHDGAGVSNINPVWSPDGSKIMYTRMAETNDLYIMNADGSNNHLVVAGGVEGAWSPDATKILFTEPGVGKRVANVDGSNRVTLVAKVDSASWSPDGSLIALESPECDCSMTPSDIITMKPDGTGKKVIARPPTSGGVGHPVWSPDSSKILFTEFAPWEPSRLVVAPANGGDKTVVIVESAGYPEWAYTPYKPAHKSINWRLDINVQATIQAYVRMYYRFSW